MTSATRLNDYSLFTVRESLCGIRASRLFLRIVVAVFRRRATRREQCAMVNEDGQTSVHLSGWIISFLSGQVPLDTHREEIHEEFKKKVTIQSLKRQKSKGKRLRRFSSRDTVKNRHTSRILSCSLSLLYLMCTCNCKYL